VDNRVVRISTTGLRPGMFVLRLDRPWLETPFMFQGFVVRDLEEATQVREYCKSVWVDIERGIKPELGCILDDRTQRVPKKDLIPPDRQQHYPDRVPTEKEIKHADVVYDGARGVVDEMLQHVRQGRPLQLDAAKQAVDAIVGSMVRNPDAMVWLNLLRRKDRSSYHHSLSVPVWAVMLGRHLGMPQSDLERLALGCLLLDIGKVRLPDELLTRRGRLSSDEFELVKQHVEYGVELLQEQPSVDIQVIYLVRSHHERHDGSGYPRGLDGLRIPLLGRIAAIADCYDAITSDRPYAETLSHYEAIAMLYDWRDVDFQAELVEQFIQAMGIYPTGSLVQLSTGEVGVVIQQSRVERLRPRLMLVLDAKQQQLAEYRRLDLMQERNLDDGRPLNIARGLEPGAYGVNPEELFL